MTALHHIIEGPADAPAVLLGGSLGANLAMWQPQLAELTTRWRVVRFDHRGQGGSPVPPGPYRIDDLGNDVLELIDHLGLHRVHYAGLSLGGMVGMWLAAHAPERIETLTLLCTAAYLPPAQGWLDRAAAVRANGMASIADAVVARWFTPRFDDVGTYRDMVAASPAEGYACCCAAIADMDLRGVLGAIAAPTLVIAGADDPATPPSFGAEIAAAVPGARLEVVAAAAHLASVEAADAVNALLTAHLLGAQAGTAHLRAGHAG